MQSLKRTRLSSMADESGSTGASWLPIGMAILLLATMMGLESLIYCHTGGGFLLP
ncbi:MAG: hypothetical protein ACM3JB_19560 [Acidobacteriaceae bacterium]